MGKNIALLELKKLVSALVLNYEVSPSTGDWRKRTTLVITLATIKSSNVSLQFDLVDPSTFTVENSWFFRQYGLNVRIKRRIAVE